MGLLLSFLGGAAEQLNANIVENKKRVYERDKRREEAADALDLYMKQNTFKSKLDEDTKIAEETRGLDLHRKKSDIDFGTYSKQKGVDLGTSKELEKFKYGLDVQKDRAKAELENAPLNNILNEIGKIEGGLGRASSEQLAPIKAKAELLQANKSTEKGGKAIADAVNTYMQRSDKRAEVFNKPIASAGGGDPFKELDDNLQKDSSLIEKVLSPKYYSDDEAEAKKESSLGNVKQLMSSMMNATRDTNQETGSPTSFSKLNSTDVKNSAIAIESSLAILDSPKASDEDKHKAVQQIDAVLSDRGIKRNDILTDPGLRTVFNEERKVKFNNYLKPVQTTPVNSGQLPEVGLPAPKSKEELDKLKPGTRFVAPDGSVRIKP